MCLMSMLYGYADNGTVSGWGSLVEAGLPPRLLHFVQVPFVSDEDCDTAYQQIGESITDTMVCAGQAGKDACEILRFVELNNQAGH